MRTGIQQARRKCGVAKAHAPTPPLPNMPSIRLRPSRSPYGSVNFLFVLLPKAHPEYSFTSQQVVLDFKTVSPSKKNPFWIKHETSWSTNTEKYRIVNLKLGNTLQHRLWRLASVMHLKLQLMSLPSLMKRDGSEQFLSWGLVPRTFLHSPYDLGRLISFYQFCMRHRYYY